MKLSIRESVQSGVLRSLKEDASGYVKSSMCRKMGLEIVRKFESEIEEKIGNELDYTSYSLDLYVFTPQQLDDMRTEWAKSIVSLWRE